MFLIYTYSENGGSSRKATCKPVRWTLLPVCQKNLSYLDCLTELKYGSGPYVQISYIASKFDISFSLTCAGKSYLNHLKRSSIGKKNIDCILFLGLYAHKRRKGLPLFLKF